MNFRKLYKPDKEFKERNKTIFLSAFKSRFVGIPQRAPAFRYFIRGAAFGAALVLVLTAGATYADQKNVGATSVLYPLKRTSEAVKVAFTKESEKTEIHLELAERRLKEIKQIREKTPQSPKINSLSKELEKELQESIFKIEFHKNLKVEALPTRQMLPDATMKGEIEKKNEHQKSQGASSVPIPSSTSSGQVIIDDSKPIEMEAEDDQNKGDSRKDVKDELKRREEKSPQLKLFSNLLDERQTNACKFWKEIIEEEDFAVTDLVSKTPEITEKFIENCESDFGSVIIKTDSSEVEVEGN